MSRLRLALLALGLFAATLAAAADSDALWKIVHGKCVPSEESQHNPKPCAEVDIGSGVDNGYAVLKDRVGQTQFLVIPTRKITGIESLDLVRPDSPNYFADAWNARSFFLARATRPLPRDVISLAINSSVGRSQNQLHIHIDCLRTDVRQALMAHAAEIGGSWAPLSFDLAGRRYQAMALAKMNLDDSNPFHLLADGDPQAKADMGEETIVVVGAQINGGDGFIILHHHADPARQDFASGEELQDHACAVAATLP